MKGQIELRRFRRTTTEVAPSPRFRSVCSNRQPRSASQARHVSAFMIVTCFKGSRAPTVGGSAGSARIGVTPTRTRSVQPHDHPGDRAERRLRRQPRGRSGRRLAETLTIAARTRSDVLIRDAGLALSLPAAAPDGSRQNAVPNDREGKEAFCRRPSTEPAPAGQAHAGIVSRARASISASSAKGLPTYAEPLKRSGSIEPAS